MEAELFHEDGQTDKHDEGNSRFPQFCEGAQEVKGFEEHFILTQIIYRFPKYAQCHCFSVQFSYYFYCKAYKSFAYAPNSIKLNVRLKTTNSTSCCSGNSRHNERSYFWLVCVSWLGVFL